MVHMHPELTRFLIVGSDQCFGFSIKNDFSEKVNFSPKFVFFVYFGHLDDAKLLPKSWVQGQYDKYGIMQLNICIFYPVILFGRDNGIDRGIAKFE